MMLSEKGPALENEVAILWEEHVSNQRKYEAPPQIFPEKGFKPLDFEGRPTS